MSACKFNDDLTLSNEDFGKVGGVDLAELNALELEFLHTINFNLSVKFEVFISYFKLI